MFRTSTSRFLSVITLAVVFAGGAVPSFASVDIQMLPPTIFNTGAPAYAPASPGNICPSGQNKVLVYSGDTTAGYSGINCAPFSVDKVGNIDVSGTLMVGPATGRADIFLKSDSQAFLSLMTKKGGGEGAYLGLGNDSWGLNDGFYIYYDQPSAALNFAAFGHPAQMVMKTNGWVGIGTVTPQAPFHLFSTFGGGVPKQGFFDSDGAEAGLTFRKTGNGTQVFSVGVGSGLTRDSKFRIVDETGGAADRLTIDQGGTIAMNNTYFVDSAGDVIVNGGGDSTWGMYWGNGPSSISNPMMGWDNNAQHLTIFGTYSGTSDVRLKKDIAPLAFNAVDTINELKPVTFLWKNSKNGGKQIGFIAQDVQKILPELVVVADDKDKTLSLKYEQLIPVLTKAVQELNANMVAQKAEIEALNAKVRELEAGNVK